MIPKHYLAVSGVIDPERKPDCSNINCLIKADKSAGNAVKTSNDDEGL